MDARLIGLAAPLLANTARSVVSTTGKLAIRPFAEVLNAISASQDSGGSPTTRSAASIEELSALASSIRENLCRQICTALEDAGLDPTTRFRFGLSPDGDDMEVQDDHPDRVLIESALAADETIASTVRQLSAIQSLVRAAQDNEPASEVPIKSDDLLSILYNDGQAQIELE